MNAHDLVTSKEEARGGPGPYRAVEPRIIIIYYIYINSCEKRYKALVNRGHTQKNGAVLIVFTIKIAPFFCVCPVFILYIVKTCTL
jgi:hypothetical protein